MLKRTGRSGSRDAPEARLGALGLADLLPVLLAPGRKVDVGPFTDRAPAAIANFLQGERAYRESDFLKALPHYHAALAADSQFALAAIKGAQSASWLDEAEETTRLTDIALAGRATLPLRFAQFALGLSAYQRGVADSAILQFRNALSLSPDWSEAWMSLGEVYYHLLPDAASLDSLARNAFDQAHRLDPDFTPPLFHLAQEALRRDDLVAAKGLIARFRRAAPDSTLDLQLALMLACVEGRLRPKDWVAAVPAGYADALEAAASLARSARRTGCAEDGFRAVLADNEVPAPHRFAALFGLQNLLMSGGRRAEVRALLASDDAAQFGGKYFYILDAAVDTTFQRDAEAVARAQGSGYTDLSPTTLWLLGIWEFHRGNATALHAIAAALAAKADRLQLRRDRLFERIVEAYQVIADRDTVEAIRKLRALIPNATRGELAWSMWESLGPERLILAQMLFKRGEFGILAGRFCPGRAAAVIGLLLYLPGSLALRARAARMMNDQIAVQEYRTRLAAFGRADLLVPHR